MNALAQVGHANHLSGLPEMERTRRPQSWVEWLLFEAEEPDRATDLAIAYAESLDAAQVAEVLTGDRGKYRLKLLEYVQNHW